MKQQKKQDPLPATIQGRLVLVGKALYGREFKARLASGLGIGRATLFRILSGRKHPRGGLDDKMRALMARERIAIRRRARDVARVEKIFEEEFGKPGEAQ